MCSLWSPAPQAAIRFSNRLRIVLPMHGRSRAGNEMRAPARGTYWLVRSPRLATHGQGGELGLPDVACLPGRVTRVGGRGGGGTAALSPCQLQGDTPALAWHASPRRSRPYPGASRCAGQTGRTGPVDAGLNLRFPCEPRTNRALGSAWCSRRTQTLNAQTVHSVRSVQLPQGDVKRSAAQCGQSLPPRPCVRAKGYQEGGG